MIQDAWLRHFKDFQSFIEQGCQGFELRTVFFFSQGDYDQVLQQTASRDGLDGLGASQSQAEVHQVGPSRSKVLQAEESQLQQLQTGSDQDQMISGGSWLKQNYHDNLSEKIGMETVFHATGITGSEDFQRERMGLKVMVMLDVPCWTFQCSEPIRTQGTYHGTGLDLHSTEAGLERLGFIAGGSCTSIYIIYDL